MNNAFPKNKQKMYCQNVPHQNEIRTIIAIVDGALGSNIRLDSPTLYEHFASEDYQSEVALLSRRIGKRKSRDVLSLSSFPHSFCFLSRSFAKFWKGYKQMMDLGCILWRREFSFFLSYLFSDLLCMKTPV